eukprot:g9341.t1
MFAGPGAWMPGNSIRLDIQKDIISSLKSDDFSAVETSFKYPNAGLIVGDKSGIRFETTRGWIGLDTNYPIASQSKIAATTVIMRIAAREDNTLSLDSNPSEFFPEIWPDDVHNLTLAHLMSFTTGFKKDTQQGCARAAARDQPEWKVCIEQIAKLPRPFEPGTSYLYGPWHLVVAAGMAQIAVGRPLTSSGWAETMRVELFEPAGISKEEGGTGEYPGVPFFIGKGTFPDFSGGMAMNARSTSKFMHALYFGGKLLDSQSLVDFDKDRTLNLTNYPILFGGNDIGHQVGLWHYAFGHWIACDASREKNAVREQKCRAENENGPRILHSVGLFGWYAWIDHEHHYYGVFAANWMVDTENTFWIMFAVTVVVTMLWSYWVTNRCGKLKDQKNINKNAKEQVADPQGIQIQQI